MRRSYGNRLYALLYFVDSAIDPVDPVPDPVDPVPDPFNPVPEPIEPVGPTKLLKLILNPFLRVAPLFEETLWKVSLKSVSTLSTNSL